MANTENTEQNLKPVETTEAQTETTAAPSEAALVDVNKTTDTPAVISLEKPADKPTVPVTEAADPSDTSKTEAVSAAETVPAPTASETETSSEEEEQVVFAGDAAALPKKEPIHNDKPEVAEESGDVVFAQADKHAPKSRIKVHKDRRLVKGLVAALLVLCVAGGGGVLAWQLSKNNVQTSADVPPESLVSTDISVAPRTSEHTADTSNSSEEPLLPEDIGGSNILFGENVTVEGVNLAGKTLSQAYDAMQDRLREIREPISITIVCDGKSLTLTQDDFNFDTNIANVLIQAYHYSRGELNEPTVENAYDGKTTNFKVQSSINTESVEDAIDKAAAFYDVQPVDAHVTSFDPTAAQKFTYADGADGFLLDHEELSSKIKGILDQGQKSGSFSIETHQTPFKVTMADIKANTRLIASHRTTASNVYNSVYNMELAIKSANGTVVMPGERFSFNATTGDTTNGNPHTYANGVTGAYLPSTAYSQGKVVQEYGGGICQASTTMFLCAVKADMKITDRYAHMYASSYADYGLDATVDYGNLDMSFINDKDYPVYIATYVYDYNGDGLDELMVEMYGPLSEKYDEVVPVGWVTYAGNTSFSARGAKVYFKNGQEVGRENLPSGSYDYHYESYYTVINHMPADISYGPSASATYSTPTIYSPNGCGENGPVAYGTAEEVLKKARSTPSQASQASQASQTSQSSKTSR